MRAHGGGAEAGTELDNRFPAEHSSELTSKPRTLQELLAPRSVEFYSANWKPLGTKASLCNIIARFTGIDTEYLKGSLPAQHASIAKRMSWASARQTTREEDLAYCLIGIFEVNMTMLYGEGGKRAFLRLQEEIMRANEDQTLFAWIKDDGIPEDASGYHGLLADSPSDFARTGNSVAYSEHSDVTPSSMTARGLHATLPLYQKDDGTAIAALWCPVPQRGYNDWLAIYLERLPIGTNQYARVACKRLASVAELGSNQEVYVRQHFPRYALQTVYPYHFFQLDRLRSSSSYAKLGEYQLVDADKLSNAADSGNVHVQAVQPRQWCLPKVPRVYTIKKQAGALAAAIRVLRLHDNEAFILMLGSSSEFEVGFDVDEEALPSKTFQNLRLGFNPRPAGTVMKLKYHTVQVTVQEHVRGGNKFYSIDVDIQAFPKPSTFTEVIQDVVEYVAQPTGPEKTENRAAIKDELKRPWRAFWRRASGQR